MTKFIFILAVAVGAFVWHKHQENQGFKQQLAYQRALASGEDNCSGKKFCVVTYMAPWCPACKSVLPKVQGFISKNEGSPTYGFKVYVGQGQKPGDNEKMASTFGSSGIVDHDGSVRKKFSVRQYPSFYVVDKEGSVILENNEAWQWMHEKL